MHNIAPQTGISSSINDNAHILLPQKQEYYRFIASASQRKEQLTLAGTQGIFLLILLFVYYIQKNPQLLPALGNFLTTPSRQEFLLLWFICTSLAFIVNIFRYFSLCRRYIEISQKGITAKGFPYSVFLKLGVPKYTAWKDLSKICNLDIQLWKRLKNPSSTRLTFTLKNGKEFYLLVAHRKEELYQSVAHTLTLLQAIETFYSPSKITHQGKPIGSLITPPLSSIDLGKQVGHVAYTALILACVSTILLFSLPVSALDNPMQIYIYGGIGIIAAFIAYQYMRPAENKPGVLASSILAGGSAAFLMLPALGALPILLGEQVQETFTIIKDQDNVQIWRMDLQPEHTFNIYVPPKKRTYQGEGVTRTFNIYRGPLGFYAILNSERNSTQNK